MKNKKLKILSAIFLTAIYCFAMVVVSHATSSKEIQGHTQNADSYFTNLTTNPFFHTTPVEGVVDVSSSLTTGSTKNLQNDFWALPAKADIHFHCKFHQYKNEAVQFLVYYLKAELIFPFHYFW